MKSKTEIRCIAALEQQRADIREYIINNPQAVKEMVTEVGANIDSEEPYDWPIGKHIFFRLCAVVVMTEIIVENQDEIRGSMKEEDGDGGSR